jgi:hypothetical protein
MKAKRVVNQNDLNHLPTDVHKKVARHLIFIGEWAMTPTSGVTENYNF